MEATARLRNVPLSPRKLRLVADLVRGTRVDRGLNVLKLTHKKCSLPIQKLLLSAMANWEVKNEGATVDDNVLYVKSIYVDGASMLKRLNPAPQGRAHRIRKRSSHVTLVVDVLPQSDAVSTVDRKTIKTNTDGTKD